MNWPWESFLQASFTLGVLTGGWFAKGLLDDGAKSVAKGLVRRRVARLPESLRADYLEMWLAELPHFSPAGQVLWVVGLYLTSPKRFKPLMAPIRTATVIGSGGLKLGGTADVQVEHAQHEITRVDPQAVGIAYEDALAALDTDAKNEARTREFAKRLHEATRRRARIK